ncbi:MAG: hypothetical protein JW973_08490 [Bacteroidales bacterium]|nr:hypothetical protein [Bacteroidales bacterium]
MKRIIPVLLLLHTLSIASQDYTYCTRYGDNINPVDTIRILNIFVNIVFDQCDSCDILRGKSTPLWMPGPANTLNVNPPVYLNDYIDVEFDTANIRGAFTRFFAQASFNRFIVLGDYVIVNIAESKVTPDKPGASFSYQHLMDSSISLINEMGGLQTLYGHDSTITQYDGSFTANHFYKFKPANNFNDKIDIIQFWVRNCTAKFGSVDGGGKTGINISKKINIHGKYYGADVVTYQGRLGNNDLSHPTSQMTDVHELAHNLIRNSNTGHMGGGGPLNIGDLTTLDANSGGWSLLGGAGSSLVSCNGFERWWLNWRGPYNNRYPIAASNDSSDIQKNDGTRTFYLRDFMTWGDVVRIKLPYLDSGALNQYIWLEYHAIHKNGKVDFPAFWEIPCKDDGVAGIYAYYQVGKDILESNDINDLRTYLTDHLVPICADGNWDISLGEDRASACVADGLVEIQEYFRENPLSGNNDLKNHFFNSVEEDILNWKQHRKEFVIKRQNGEETNKLANMGDNEDAFTGVINLSLCSNPALFNVVTYHHTRPGNTGKIYKSGRIDNRKIHISGLRVDMVDQQNGTYRVDVRWDFYDVTRDLIWTGDIVLHEKVNLTPGKVLTFDQNYTPSKHIRDSITGLFAGPTYFTCLGNSSFIMQSSSKVILQNLSSFIIESGSLMEINDSAVYTVKSKSTLQIKSGAKLVIKGSGKIEVENGGYLCIEKGAVLVLSDTSSIINLRPGFNLGRNESAIAHTGSYYLRPASIDYAGNGSVNAYYE